MEHHKLGKDETLYHSDRNHMTIGSIASTIDDNCFYIGIDQSHPTIDYRKEYKVIEGTLTLINKERLGQAGD